MQPFKKAKAAQNIYITVPFSLQTKGIRNYPLLTPETGLMESYIDTLVTEIHKTVKTQKRDEKQPVESLYISGGDPLLLSRLQFRKIKEALEEHFEFTEKTEFTLRVTPKTVTKERLEQFADEGVNRVSIGVPTFNEKILRTMDNGLSRKEALEACEAVLNEPRFEKKCIEMMYGLPSQTIGDIEKTLEEAKEIETTHITVNRMPKTQREHFGIKDEDADTMYDYISSQLTSEGWDHYDLKCLAKSPESFCRHNTSFRKNKDFYGFGMGATSFLDACRVVHPNDWEGYKDFVAKMEIQKGSLWFDESSSFQQFAVKLSHGLRCKSGFNLKEFETKMVPEVYTNCLECMMALVNFNLLENGSTKEVFCSQVTSGYLSINETMKFILQRVPQSSFFKA